MTVSGIGIVIGAGIYVVIGSAAAEAGNAVWLAFIVAALMSGLTGLSYAELVSMYPSAAAEYEFARQAFNEFIGFLAGWAMLAAYVIAAAAVATGFGHYLQIFWDVDVRLSAICLLAVLTMVVMTGLRRSIWMSMLLVLLQVGGLILVIVAGMPHLGHHNLLEGASASGVLHGSALVFFAFIGFDDITTLSEETKDPYRTMPRALLATLGVSTLLYALVGISAVSVLGGDALSSSRQPLAAVIAHDWGSRAADIVAVIALASTVNTTLLILTAGSRIIYGMARRGSFPSMLGKVGKRGGSPFIAAAIILAVTAGFSLLGSIELIASATDMAVYVVFVFANLSLIVLRFRRPRLERGFKVPGSLGPIPIIPGLALATVLTMMAYLPANAWLVGGGVLLSGLVARLLLGRTDHELLDRSE